MKMDVVAGSGNDEFYTPQYAIEPILKYVPADIKIWCPFDTEESLFVKTLAGRGHDVSHTHLSQGRDFFFEPLPDRDTLIISNPPYSLKTEVIGRLLDGDCRFAMLVGVVGLFESQRRFDMFKNHDFEIMYFNRRVSYFRSYAKYFLILFGGMKYGRKTSLQRKWCGRSARTPTAPHATMTDAITAHGLRRTLITAKFSEAATGWPQRLVELYSRCKSAVNWL